MAVDLLYNFDRAVKAGVKFTPNMETRYLCPDSCSCKHGGDYCSEVSELTTYHSGFLVECPDGSKGYSIIDGLFQCKNMNLEIREWFLRNVKGSRVSY